eukprot:5283746-Amphidinium_carterae.1
MQRFQAKQQLYHFHINRLKRPTLKALGVFAESPRQAGQWDAHRLHAGMTHPHTHILVARHAPWEFCQNMLARACTHQALHGQMDSMCQLSTAALGWSDLKLKHATYAWAPTA